MSRPSGNFPETRPTLLRTLRGAEGGEPAWREFFERYAPAVYRVARRRGLTHEDADDVVQQVMLSVANHIGEFEYNRNRGRFRQWITAVAANKVRDLLRRRKASRMISAPGEIDECIDDAPDLDALWQEEWRVQDLLYCLDQVAQDISPRRFQAFKLYVLEGVSAEETAQRLNMTRAYVYVTRAQVRKRVRELMRELEENGRE